MADTEKICWESYATTLLHLLCLTSIRAKKLIVEATRSAVEEDIACEYLQGLPDRSTVRVGIMAR